MNGWHQIDCSEIPLAAFSVQIVRVHHAALSLNWYEVEPMHCCNRFESGISESVGCDCVSMVQDAKPDDREAVLTAGSN